MKARRVDKAAPATINREVEHLRTAFRIAVESGKLARVPIFPKALTEANARRCFFEGSEFMAVLDHIKDADVLDFLEFFYWTGMRPGEIKSLVWSDFDRETMNLRLHESTAKTRRGRTLVAEGVIRPIVERRNQARRLGCEFVFHRRGKQMGEFRKLWKTAASNAGVVDRHPYDLRRTAVKNMVRAGVNESVARSISGHRTRAVFDRYNIVDEDDLRAAVRSTTEYVSPEERKKARTDQKQLVVPECGTVLLRPVARSY